MPHRRDGRTSGLTKVIVIFMAALAIIQLIKPLGLPGLRHRSDAWKVALGGLVLMVLAIGFVTFLR